MDTKDISTGNCKSEYLISNVCTSPYYENNKEILLGAFGSKCTVSEDETYCYVNNFITVRAQVDGYVGAYYNPYFCAVGDDGTSNCG